MSLMTMASSQSQFSQNPYHKLVDDSANSNKNTQSKTSGLTEEIKGGDSIVEERRRDLDAIIAKAAAISQRILTAKGRYEGVIGSADFYCTIPDASNETHAESMKAITDASVGIIDELTVEKDVLAREISDFTTELMEFDRIYKVSFTKPIDKKVTDLGEAIYKMRQDLKFSERLPVLKLRFVNPHEYSRIKHKEWRQNSGQPDCCVIL